MILNPNLFAGTDYDTADRWMFGDPPERKPDEERAQLDEAYLIFVGGAGALVLRDLIERFLSKPTMNPALGLLNGTANGWIREGQNSVVRELIDRMEKAMQTREQRRA